MIETFYLNDFFPVPMVPSSEIVYKSALDPSEHSELLFCTFLLKSVSKKVGPFPFCRNNVKSSKLCY